MSADIVTIVLILAAYVLVSIPAALFLAQFLRGPDDRA